MKKFLVFLAAAALLAGGGMFCSEEEEDEKAYVRFTNETGANDFGNITGGGATWIGPYADGTTTEAKEVETGNQLVEWTCGGGPHSTFVDVEEGHWRLIVNNCDATGTTTVEE